MSVEEQDLFGGEPVIKFESELDRRNFLKTAKVVGFGASLAFVAAACSKKASTAGSTPTGAASAAASASAGPNPDLPILNYALTLEYLEANFYKQGLAGNIMTGRTLALVTPIEAHEQAHVATLTATIQKLGGTPVASPTFVYPTGTFTSEATFLKTASTFEELGVTAYQGQVTLIQTPAILGAAASIAGVESRHAAILASLIAGNPFPAPVEAHNPMSTVLADVKPYLGS